MQRNGGFDLGFELLALQAVAVEVEQHARGVVLFVAGHQGSIVLQQAGDGAVAEGDLRVVEQHQPDVFNGHTTHFTAVCEGDVQLPVLCFQVGRVAEV